VKGTCGRCAKRASKEALGRPRLRLGVACGVDAACWPAVDDDLVLEDPLGGIEALDEEWRRWRDGLEQKAC
jgi:hypothetical protein